MSRLTVEHHDTTTLLRLDAPDRRNALDLPTMQALVTALRAADDDPRVRAVVLTGADPAFCAGLDLAAVAGGELVLEDVEAHDADVWQVLQTTTTPTIAAVNGPAVTGGLELVLCCDLAIASERASFADTHARVGIHPSGGMTVLLPRLVGARVALDMSLTGRFVPAAEAARHGLVTAAVPHDELLPTAMATAAALAETDVRVAEAMLATYRTVSGMPRAAALAEERTRGRAMQVDQAAVEARRTAVIARGRAMGGAPRDQAG